MVLKLKQKIQIGKYKCWITSERSDYQHTYYIVRCYQGYCSVFTQFGITMEDINKHFKIDDHAFPDFKTLTQANEFIKYLLTFDKIHLQLWL